VPYTGATGAVDLGSNALTAGAITLPAFPADIGNVPTWGFRFNSAASLDIFQSSAIRVRFSAGSVSCTQLGLGSSPVVSSTSLGADAANVLTQRNGLNAQSYDLFGTYTSGTSFEKLRIGYSYADSGYLISHEIGSAGGTARDLRIGHRNAAGTFAAGVTISTAGHTTIIPPTTDPGIAGAIWNDGGTLAISAG